MFDKLYQLAQTINTTSSGWNLPCHLGSSTSTPFSLSKLPTKGDTNLSSSASPVNSRISYTGVRRSCGPCAKAQCGPFLTQNPLESVSYTHVLVL